MFSGLSSNPGERDQQSDFSCEMSEHFYLLSLVWCSLFSDYACINKAGVVWCVTCEPFI